MMGVRYWSVLVSISYCLVAALTPALALGITERVSVSSGGVEGNDCSACYSPISADGRYMAFMSYATNLVAGDANAKADIFVRDRESGTTERVSVSSIGAEANAESERPSISADGRYVAFDSDATNLVEGDSNGCPDVFVRDRLAGTTERVSVSSAQVGGNLGSCGPAISADGRYVTFFSWASNLVPGDTNEWGDIFVRDRLAQTTERVSLSSAGAEGNNDSVYPSISADGRYVAFESDATNLVEGDNNLSLDVFVRDRVLGTTERVSLDSDEVEGDDESGRPSISADGRYVAFWSSATNLVAADNNLSPDVFVRDRDTGTTERVSVSSAGAEGNSHSVLPSISADGRHVAFHSCATNLVKGDTNYCFDVFVRDRMSGDTERVSVNAAGAEGNSNSGYPCITADGRYVTFDSLATNLVSGDSNGLYDIFVHGLPPYPVPEVLLEVHPNERAPGVGTNQYIGKSPWSQPTSSPAGSYWWKKYEFAAHGPLWIQVCAQNWDKTQKGYGDHDDTKLTVNTVTVVDYDGIQSGAPGTWQWTGGAESGQRVTLRFLVSVTPGKQNLWIGADESPVLWWLKVIDLEPGVVEAF